MTDEKGKTLLTAVERILASSDSLRSTVEAARLRVKSGVTKTNSWRELAAQELVRSFSNRAAIAGGAAGLPSLIPGIGSIALSVGGGLAELTFLLKWEVELALCLSHLYGFDIDDPQERQLGFLMASVGTYDASGKNFFADVMRIEGTALWNYAPRAISRMVIRAMALLAAIYVWHGFLKAIPVLGIALGSSMNKVLTKRVGERVMRDLRTRRELLDDASGGKKKKAKKKSKTRRAAASRPTLDDLN
jgi:hypothetical protein